MMFCGFGLAKARKTAVYSSVLSSHFGAVNPLFTMMPRNFWQCRPYTAGSANFGIRLRHHDMGRLYMTTK